KTPLEPHRDIIRVWGLLNDYRPPGQTSWSRAVVRHQIDPRTALAAVLGVTAEDLQVREGADAEPDTPAKASTVPSPRPNNPSPNTEAGAQPSNGGPGFPSGDN